MSEEDLVRWLVRRIAETSDLTEDEVDPDRPLGELGMASRDAVGLAGDLEDLLDRDLNPTLVFENPTIRLLARALTGSDGSAAQIAPDGATDLTADVTTDVITDLTADEAPARADDPIAIVGLGCRLPGGADPAAFWGLLDAGADGVGSVPEGRWESFGTTSAAGARVLDRTTRWGGFIGDVTGFDADFFGINPREAETMDPQQRLLLEVTWEALQQAGVPPESLRGTRTGVWVGISTNEYSHITAADPTDIDPYTATGSAFSIAANRISYLLDLRGPSVALDTACSSSLVAVHQACQSLRLGETGTALVAGVNLLLSPAITINFDSAGALAADGRCKPFSADADGITRGEGAGVLVLKRLSDARRDGDRVLALIRGSAVNSDGRSNVLVAPNPQAQEDVLRTAYESAGVDPHTVDYVEAHGTGTLLGDPIEASALGAVLGRGRPADRPLLLGSVKSNIGHLESAAGVAGIIKVVLAMGHDRIPASLHFAAPNPHIPFEDARLRVVDAPTGWPRHGGVARAGVSGFGFGGTNAHVILEEPPAPAAVPDPPAAVPLPVDVLAVSAQSEARMRTAAGDLADWLRSPAGADAAARDVAYTLARRRGQGRWRGGVVGRGRDALIEGLRALADGVESPAAPVGRTGRVGAGPVLVFSGYGSQWRGMGRGLLADEPAFAAAVDAMDPVFVAEAGVSLRGLLEGEGERGDLFGIQLSIFGMQLALAALWRSYGVEPGAVVGNSQGEIAAAHVAGALDLGTAVRVMAARSRLLTRADAHEAGAMALVELTAQELEALSDRFPDVTVAVHASPSQSTVGGDTAQVAALVDHVESLGRHAFAIKVSGAGHTAAVEPILPELTAVLAEVTGGTPAVSFYGTVHDDPHETPAFDGAYWVANTRRPVRFTQAVAAAVADGHTTFLEISPHPVASLGVAATVLAGGVKHPVVAYSQRRNTDDAVTFRTALAQLHANGAQVDLAHLHPTGRSLELPGIRWDRRRHWMERAHARTGGAAIPVGAHPLLGEHIEVPGDTRHVWRTDVGTAVLPWLADHRINGVTVLPVSSYVEMALTASAQVFGVAADAVAVTGLDLSQLLPIGEHTEMTVVLVPAGATATVEIFTRGGDGGWVSHAGARVRRLDVSDPTAAEPAGAAEPAVVVPAESAAQRWDDLAAHGSPVDVSALVGLADARTGTAGAAVTAAVRATLPATATPDPAYSIHPAMLDVCLQALLLAAIPLHNAEHAGSIYLPAGVGAVRVPNGPFDTGRCYATLTPLDEDNSGLIGTLRVLDDAGTSLLEIDDVYLRRVDPSAAVPADAYDDDIEADDWPGLIAMKAAAPAEARAILSARIIDRMCAILGLRPEQLDVETPLTQLGMDSLMAVRAKNALEHDLGVQLPIRLLLQGANLLDFEDHLAAELGIDAPGVPPQRSAAPGLVRSPGAAAPTRAPARPGFVGPRDATERWVAYEWSQVLGRDEIGVTEDFFAIGGDDARAAEVTGRIRDRLGDKVDTAGLFEVPTVERIADRVRDALEGVDGHVRVLRAHGRRLPLFLLHPAGGTTVAYQELVTLLGDDQPVYGLERLDDLRTIETKAVRYIELIREIQPHGPYHLGGWSLGGALGYEVARQLTAAGETVGAVLMMDTIMPLEAKDRPGAEIDAERLQRFTGFIEDTYGRPLGVDLEHLNSLDEDGQIEYLLDSIRAADLGLGESVLEHQRASYVDGRIAEKYDVQPFDGKIVLYRAESAEEVMVALDPRYWRTDEALGWDAMCDDIEIVAVSGHHLSMMDRPNIDVVARHLSALMAEASSERV